MRQAVSLAATNNNQAQSVPCHRQGFFVSGETRNASIKKGEQNMAVVGIDLGSQHTKALILEGDVIFGGALPLTGGRRVERRIKKRLSS
jgi:activator of 2-hydroxyglutaryl-CoA dehydratase